MLIQRLGKWLSKEHFHEIISSDLERAHHTARIIHDKIINCEEPKPVKPDLVLDERVREKCAGIYDGAPYGSTA